MSKECFQIVLTSFFFINIAGANENAIQINKKIYSTCISSNGIPNHKIGQFPTHGNPHEFRAQNVTYCFPSNPTKRSYRKPSYRAKVIGITLTGMPIRPGTADWYDASSHRGHSRNKSSGWNLEAIRPFEKIFGIDDTNGHVDRRGLYHYHKITDALIKNDNSHIGYAADGFQIHYIKDDLKTSWQLKEGKRPTEPFGNFDGSFHQDYEYIENSGDLDECNGKLLEGVYTYFATNVFPFFPRCHWGEVGQDFVRR